jgi:hypothetical protein
VACVAAATTFGGLPRRRGGAGGAGRGGIACGGLARMSWLCQEIRVLSQPIAGAFDLYDQGVVKQPVKQGRGDDRITKHLVMPQCLTGESLKCGWLIRTILFMASAFRSAVAARDGDRG